MNILTEAHGIVYERNEEKERQYGDFHESMLRAADIAGIDVPTMYMAMVGLKLSREQHKHKRDNILDAISYLASLNDWQDKFNG